MDSSSATDSTVGIRQLHTETEDIALAATRGMSGMRHPMPVERREFLNLTGLTEEQFSTFVADPLGVEPEMRQKIVESVGIESVHPADDMIYGLPPLFRHRMGLETSADWYLTEEEIRRAFGNWDPDVYAHVEMGGVPGAVITRHQAIIPLSGLLWAEWDGVPEIKKLAEKFAGKAVRVRRRAGMPTVLADLRPRTPGMPARRWH